MILAGYFWEYRPTIQGVSQGAHLLHEFLGKPLCTASGRALFVPAVGSASGRDERVGGAKQQQEQQQQRDWSRSSVHPPSLQNATKALRRSRRSRTTSTEFNRAFVVLHGRRSMPS